jgi:hypothetical protein
MVRAFVASLVVLFASASAALAEPQLVQDENGDAALVFDILRQPRPIFATAAPGGGSFGPLTQLTPAGGGFPPATTVAPDEQGGAVAAWAGTGGIGTFPRDVFVSIKPPGGEFGAPQRLSLPGHTAGIVSLDVNARGDAVVAWFDYAEDGLTYAYRPAGGSFGPPEGVPGPITHDLSVVLEADGGALFLGDSTPAVGGNTVNPWSVHRSSEGTFAAPVQLAGVPALDTVAVAGNRRGDVLLAWAKDRTLAVAERPVGGTVGPASVVATGVDTEGYSVPVRAVINDDEDAVVLFSDPTVRVLVREGSGSFGAPRRLASSRSASVYTAGLAVDEHGDAAVAWSTNPQAVRAAYRVRGGSFGSVMTLRSALGVLAGPYPPSVAIDGAGTATAVWEEGDGESVFIRSRRFAALPAATSIVVTVPSYIQEAPPEACAAHSSVLAKNARAVITTGLRGCLLARGTPIDLGQTHPYAIGDTSNVQSRRIALAGPYAASVLTVRAHEGEVSTWVSIVDLRDEWSGRNRAAPASNVFGAVPVPTLRLRRDGAAAWVARSGRRMKQVFAFGVSRRNAKLLGHGTKIVPASLRIDGTRVRWRDGRHRRSAPLG